MRVDSVRFDYTGQFVAATGPSGVVVWCYVKTGKEWKEILRKGVRGVAVEWGNRAGSLVTLSAEGAVTVLETKE